MDNLYGSAVPLAVAVFVALMLVGFAADRIKGTRYYRPVGRYKFAEPRPCEHRPAGVVFVLTGTIGWGILDPYPPLRGAQ